MGPSRDFVEILLLLTAHSTRRTKRGRVKEGQTAGACPSMALSILIPPQSFLLYEFLNLALEADYPPIESSPAGTYNLTFLVGYDLIEILQHYESRYGLSLKIFMTNSPNKVFAQANHDLVNLVGSFSSNDSCMKPVPTLDLIRVSRHRLISSSS